jgi:transcription elongation factor Elf1
MMSGMIQFKKHYNTPWNVCFRCGSLRIVTLNEEGNTQVLKCSQCLKVWTRTKKPESGESGEAYFS